MTEVYWYAFLVPPQKEYVAAFILRRLGADTYIPTETRWRRKNRYAKTKVEVAFPIAPRYVFAGFDAPPAWYEIFNLPVISAVVGLNGKPKRLSTDAVDIFRSRVPNGELVVDGAKSVITRAKAPSEQRYMVTHREFAAGDVVDITDGPFRELRVTVRQIKGPIAKIIVPLFGEEREAEVPVQYLEAVA